MTRRYQSYVALHTAIAILAIAMVLGLSTGGEIYDMENYGRLVATFINR